jgi:hypothetical protein
MMMTKWASTPEENAAFGNETPGRGMEEAKFHHHHCYPKTALVHPGVDKVGVEETEGMVAEDVGEAYHIELSRLAEEHRPLGQIWCLEKPSCIVLLSSQEVRFPIPETKTHYIRGVGNMVPRARVDLLQ